MMRKWILICTAVLFLFCTFTASVTAAEENVVIERLDDKADLLTVEEQEIIRKKLDVLSEKYSFDVAIVTFYGTFDTEASEVAPEYFKANVRGQDGCVLAIDITNSQLYLSTHGYGMTVFTEDGIEYINDQIAEKLSEEQYLQACEIYISTCEKFIVCANEGNLFDYSDLPITVLDVLSYAVAAIVVGFIVALIVVSVMKGKLKTVRRQSAARNYLKEGSFVLTEKRDLFLYRTITRTPRPKANNNSGGGSAGRSHGGGGRSF